MSITVTATWSGKDEVLAKLEKAALVAPAALGARLYTEAQLIMTGIKAKDVPVDLGTLRDSGYVEPPVVTPPSGVHVNLGFGGAAAAYAHYQHEGVSRAGNPLHYQRPTAHAHFLTEPVEAAREKVAEALGEEAARIVGGGA